jgi:hypothetical protein
MTSRSQAVSTLSPGDCNSRPSRAILSGP